MQKSKQAEACKHFEAAIRIYPQYALAHAELGRAFELAGNLSSARSSYQAAIEADKRYIKPLVQLAALEARAENWDASARAADAAIALNAIEYPGASFIAAWRISGRCNGSRPPSY